jgi:hypothetical protein
MALFALFWLIRATNPVQEALYLFSLFRAYNAWKSR